MKNVSLSIVLYFIMIMVTKVSNATLMNAIHFEDKVITLNGCNEIKKNYGVTVNKTIVDFFNSFIKDDKKMYLDLFNDKNDRLINNSWNKIKNILTKNDKEILHVVLGTNTYNKELFNQNILYFIVFKTPDLTLHFKRKNEWKETLNNMTFDVIGIFLDVENNKLSTFNDNKTKHNSINRENSNPKTKINFINTFKYMNNKEETNNKSLIIKKINRIYNFINHDSNHDMDLKYINIDFNVNYKKDKNYIENLTWYEKKVFDYYYIDYIDCDVDKLNKLQTKKEQKKTNYYINRFNSRMIPPVASKKHMATSNGLG